MKMNRIIIICILIIVILFIAEIVIVLASHGGELRQRMFNDISGRPVYIYTDDAGKKTEIRQKMFNDIQGRPVYETEEVDE